MRWPPELAPIVKQRSQTALLISLPPALVDKIVSLLHGREGNVWLAAVNKAVLQLHQQIETIRNDFNQATSEDTKKELLAEIEGLEKVKRHLKRSMINCINEKKIPIAELIKDGYPYDDDTYSSIEAIINLDSQRLRLCRFQRPSAQFGRFCMLNEMLSKH